MKNNNGNCCGAKNKQSKKNTNLSDSKGKAEAADIRERQDCSGEN